MPQAAEQIAQLQKALQGFGGLRYLAALTIGLTRALNTRYAFVSRPKAGQPHFAETVVMAENGEAARPMVYDLRHAPCRSVFGGQSLTIPCNLIDLYPGQAGFDAYCGVPLIGPSGVADGVLAVLAEHPFDETEVTAVLSAFAPACLAALLASEAPAP